LNIRRLVGDNLAIIVQCIVTLIAGFSIAFVSDWKLTLIIICVIPLIGSQNYFEVKFLKGFSEDAKVKTSLLGHNHFILRKQSLKVSPNN